MINKKIEPEEIQRLIREKIDEEKRISMLGRTAGSMICALAKHAIKTSGYGVVSKVLMRELRNLAKKDVKKIIEIFEIKEKTPENASRILKIAAYILGLKMVIKDEETTVVECPYGACVKEFRDPFICNVCLEYCRGAVEEMLGPEFIFDRVKWAVKGDDGCTFKIQKRA
jgi:predicted hydrocarbon binding protein